jgi:RHS repeat-associated protein
LTRSFNGYGEMEGEQTSVSGQNLSIRNLTRDNNGRITQKTETVGGTAATYVYGYDGMGRLLSVTKDSVLVEEYQYNANGSREYEVNALRGITGRALNYSDEDHLLNVGGVIFQHNLDGFLTSKTDGTETTLYSYSSQGELLNATLPDGTVVSYIHDPMGRRIAKKVNGTITEKYLWQGLTQLLAVYDGSNNLLMRFKYADGRMPVSMEKEGAVYYPVYDQAGTLRLVADAAGNVVKRIDYDSFGNIIADTNPGFSIPFGFAGGLYDKDTGLVRFGYRDYDPDTGRWTAKDPILFNGRDTDLYGYCLNDPVNYIDPNGKELIGAVVGAVGGAIVNGTYAYMNDKSVLDGALVGAGAGLIAGLTLNPYLAGALIGAANTAGNIAVGIDTPCDNTSAVLKGAAVGFLGGGVAGNLGEDIGNAAPVIGRALGEVIGGNTINVIQGINSAFK